MPHIGRIETYDPSEPFSTYLERLNEYFLVNNIGTADSKAEEAVIKVAERQKVAAFISVIGKQAYAILSDLTKPGKPNDKSFEVLTNLLKDHYHPKTIEVAETFKFHRCFQQETETVNTFCVRLRGCADKCNFGTFLNRALRDQFVSGIRSRDTQKKLLEEDRSFAQCVELAKSNEAANRESEALHKEHSETVNFVRKQKSKLSKEKKPWEKEKSLSYSCFSCGKDDHKRADCYWRDAMCHKCKRKGHISTVCKGKVNFLDEKEQEEDQEFLFLQERESDNLLVMSNASSNGIQVPLKIEGQQCSMLLDTGASRTIVPRSFFNKYCKHAKLVNTDVTLQTYTHESVVPEGKAVVSVEYQGQTHSLSLLVVKNGNVALFGRDWLNKIKLDWKSLPGLNYVRATESKEISSSNVQGVEKIVEKFGDLFSNELGCYSGQPVELEVVSQPKFYKARPVPFAIREKVKKALDEMEREGVLKKISSSSCAAPMVAVRKKNSDDLRICGDFSVTYNACAELVQYPIPKIEDLHAALRGCSVFSVLDMKSAYHQIPISENSQKFLTINTIQGLYMFTRLAFGIHSAPGLFQQIMDSVLAGIPKVICYLDDILVAGENKADHEKTLIQVFKRLQHAGFRLSKSKCYLQKRSVQYLGHVIDAQGLHPTEDKLKAIQDAPAPTNVTQLKSFLGLILFYAKFIPNHSTLLSPLNELLRKDVKWRWSKKEDSTFRAAKVALMRSKTLIHYDETLPLYLACDASAYGAGAVLSHRINGLDRPIAFASCTLTDTQKNYSQTCKEAFSIMFGLQRFRQFLCGRSFTIITDHKSLLEIFSPSRQVPIQAAARLQRWSLILASYNYKLEFRSTTAHANADGVSRLPLSRVWDPPMDNVECYFFEDDVITNVTHDMIRKRTSVDPVLSKVYRYCSTGWPKIVDSELFPYKSRSDELTLEQGCVLWGTRVIIPSDLQEMVLKELHETHPGSTRMKMLARSFVWWPKLDATIEDMVNSCVVCQSLRSDPPKAQVHPWTYPAHPWSRLHVDFAGPVDGKVYFVLIDAYSKFPEIVKMKSTTAEATINVLREIFSRQGLPEMIVSDNGPQFTAQEFKDFCAQNGILHRTTAVYKPSSNGQAERCVRILKDALKQAKRTGQNPDRLLLSYLLTYRNTPHSTTGKSPAMLLYGRRLRTRLDLMLPSVNNQVYKSQNNVMKRTEEHPVRTFVVGDTVLARNFQRGEKWCYGTVEKVLGERHYVVKVEMQGENLSWKRHVDQLMKVPERSFHNDSNNEKQVSGGPVTEIIKESVLPDVEAPSVESNDVQVSNENISNTNGVSTEKSPEPVSEVVERLPEISTSDSGATVEKRYPTRVRKQPSYLKDYVNS